MNILSLFDGCSGARLALSKASIKVNRYYSSEIDKYALEVANANFPEDSKYRLGDITKIKGADLPKIDIIIGGSPCQGFSFAGNQLNFKHSESKLFFEFIRLLKEIKPKYFLLENVLMKKEYQNVISCELAKIYPTSDVLFGTGKVEPIMINSAKLSAQSRKRLYWANFPIKQPKNTGVYIKDILENNIIDKKLKYINRKIINKKLKNVPIQIGKIKDGGFEMNNRVYLDQGKSPTITTGSSSNKEVKIGIYKETNSWQENHHNIFWRKITPLEAERLQTLPDNYTDHVSKSQRYKMIGNGFTINVISHILSNISEETAERLIRF